MKRLAVILMTLLLAMAQAAAQTTTMLDENGNLAWTDFDNNLPPEAQHAFASVLREGDRILCGALQSRNAQMEGILAAEREGKLLLMGAVLPKGAENWTAAIETDSFFMPQTQIDMTVEPVYDINGVKTSGTLTIVYGAERYGVYLYDSGAMRIESYTRMEEGGGTLSLLPIAGSIICYRYQDGERETLYSAHGVMPIRFAAWTHASFPKSEQDARRVNQAYALQLEEDEAFISGGNLREEPTGSSDSWGQYSAKAKVLGSKMGTREPWIQVQVGNLTGWVSDNYVLTEQDDPVRFYGVPSAMTKVARADSDIALRSLPGGQTLSDIPAGTLMHVLMEKDGWLHVIILRGEISWQTDWDGTYGFVRADEVATGVSIADVMWK